MYVIMIYDVNTKRVAKVLRIARKYLRWVQKSVLEGMITEKNYKELREKIRKIISEEDSVYWYILNPEFVPYRKVIGDFKPNVSNFV
ncbi:CRISPR-associated endonuclease Cas2 [Thermosipho ferrireducens]|uniref:CRISPR-associated endoribonuclease Cas2 n=1 Tax=Thermosipho ferrireducens TaxID=2571116 RepID=A0ABX7SA75_9BACT|nr:CRISPR-associated endonuclease Cas2 [Thermosipho ferrireducens]QTA38800.1 CRISPR-associated endonuclease Cas2 [Thermosipho ferrireducens]